MKVLIVCDLFPPAFGPRMGYLCKYMKRNGWEPVVVTEYIEDQTFAFLKGETEVTYVRYYKTSKGITRKLEWLSILFMDFLFHYKERKMINAATPLLKEGKYAGILCSTYRAFPLPAAQKIAERFKLPLVADLRDIIEQYAANEFIAHSFHTFPWLDRQITKIFRNRLLKDRNKALAKTACITTVSPWHAEVLKEFNPKTELIYNGYDPELFFPEQHKTERFTITYTGRLISLATRDPRLLFEAITRLDKEKIITPDTFRVEWYIDNESKTILETFAGTFPIFAYFDFPGYVPASKIPGILNRSSILLQLANKTTASGPKGFMTTKLFEAMAVEKPLLCVRSDESCLEETINRTQTGLAARTAEEVYDFLFHYYREWQVKGYTSIQVNREEVEKFSRKKQAEQFINIFTELNHS